MKTVVLIYPNQTQLEPLLKFTKYPNVGYRSKPMINLGILYLVDVLKDDYRVHYLDNNISKLRYKALLKWILDKQPDIVGLGGTFTEWPEAMSCSKALRAKGIKTIYGGSNATANPEKHVKYFDYVLRGEGEEAFKRFLDNDFNINVNGINTVEKWTRPTFNYNNRHTPARSIINLKKYRQFKFHEEIQRPIDVVMASRGCPFGCKFCSSKFIWDQHYSIRPIQDVLDEVEHMKTAHGTKTIHFREDNLTVNKKFLSELCDGLKRLNIDWICQSRVDSLNYNTIAEMKQSGCKMICCGFESANNSTLEYIKKGITFEQIDKCINDFEKAGIYWAGGFMVGVLNEGKQEIINTLNYVKKIRTYKHSLQEGAARFVGFPVSELYYEMIHNNLVAYDWQDGELLIPNIYKLKYNEVDDIILNYS